MSTLVRRGRAAVGFRALPLLIASFGVLCASRPVDAQVTSAMSDPPADEQATQQSELVQGAAAKSIASPIDSTDTVRPDGSFGYRISIAVPHGVRGMQPQLALAYNSRVGNGIAGKGWTLSGIPEIHRISGGRGLNFDGDDHYAVNFNGWGTPDDPGLRLVYIGTDPLPRGVRIAEAAQQVLLDLTRYVASKVWGLSDWEVNQLMQIAANGGPTNFPPFHFHGTQVPSVDVSAFVVDPNDAAPTPNPVPDSVLNTWHQPELFSWPCETTAVRCWLRILKIDPIDWPQLALVIFGNDIFHTANETWGEYRPHGFCGDGPCYWVLRDGKGNTYYFGGDDNFHAADSDDSSTAPYPVIPERMNGDRGNRGILMWSLYQVVDRYGNGYKVSYSKGGSAAPTLVPSRVDYLRTGGATITKAINFRYENRADMTPMPANFSTRLSRIEIELGGSVQRQYALGYQAGPTHFSRLTSVQELGSDGNAANGLPPYQIAWTDPVPLQSARLVQTSPVTIQPWVSPVVADFNGDGFSDVLFGVQDYHGIARQYLMGSATGLGPPLTIGGDVWDPNASQPSDYKGGWAFVAGDVNGDGRADLVRVQLGPDKIALDVGLGTQGGVPQNFDTPRTVPWSGSVTDNDWGNWQVITADVNNDRIADVVVLHPGTPTVVYALGSRNGLLAPIVLSSHVTKLPQWAWFLIYTGSKPPPNAAVMARTSAGDINGDGSLDIMTSLTTLWNNDQWDPTPQINYIMGSDAGLLPPVAWTPPPGQSHLVWPVLADINGDNRADLVLGSNEIYYGRSELDAPLQQMAGYDPANPGYQAYSGGAADADGDGITDFVGGAFGNATGLMSPGSGGNNAGIGYVGAFFADINGDGLPDTINLASSTSDVDLSISQSFADRTWDASTTIAHLANMGGDFANVIGSYNFRDPMVNPKKYAHSVVGDFNGDGIQDVLVFPYLMYYPEYDLHGPTSTKPPYSFALPLLLSRGQTGDVVSSVTNSLGGVVTVSYTPAPQHPTAIDNSCLGCERANTSARLLVTDVAHDNGKGFSRSSSYVYKNGRVYSGGVFEDNDLGFAEIDKTDDQTQAQEIYKYAQQKPLQRRLIESRQLSATHQLLRLDTFQYSYTTPYLGVDLPQLMSKTSTSYEQGQTVSQATTTYEYGPYGEESAETRVADNVMVRTDFAYTHNPSQWLLARVDSKRTKSRPTQQITPRPLPDLLGEYIKYSFAANGVEVVRRDQLLCDEAMRCTCPRGNECTPTMSNGTPARWVGIEQNIAYDGQGNVHYTADAYGHGVTSTFDPDWGLVTSVARTVTESNGSVATLTSYKHYDGSGRLDVETDYNNANTVYHYDDFDRLRQVDRPNGAHEFHDFSQLGNAQAQAFVKTTGPSAASAAANLPLGEMVTDYVDGFGEIYREDVTAGEGKTIERTRLEYFSNGQRHVAYNRPVFATANLFPPSDPLNEWLVVDFDDANRPLQVTSLPGNNGSPTVVEKFAYTPAQLTVSDLHARSLTTTFDARGRVSTKSDGYGTWYYDFDNFDRLTDIATPDGGSIDMSYDNWGRRRSIADATLGNVSSVLDDVGNLLSTTDANGSVSFSYDEMNRMRTKNDARGMSTYSYDRSAADFTLGRLSDVTDHAGSTSLTYDAAGNVAERRRVTTGNSAPMVADYSYDFFGRLASKTLGDTVIGFSYPDGWNLREILVNGSSLARMSGYDAHRRPGSVVTSASTRSLARDARGVVTDITSIATGSGQTIQKLHIDSDLLGTQQIITDQRASTIEGSTATNEYAFFRFDADNRLATAQLLNGVMIFSYDPEGNLTQRGSLTFTPNGNQLVAKNSSGAVVATNSYDAVGNLATRDDASGHWLYGYDDDHQLLSASLNGATRVSNDYDYSGVRVKKVFQKSATESVTTYYLDELEVREDSTALGTRSTTVQVSAPSVGRIASITTGHIAGEPDLPSSLPYATTPWSGDTTSGPAQGVVFYHGNSLGNPTVLTDSQGNVVAHTLYDPYGQILGDFSVGRDVSTAKFASKEGDAELNLVNFGARYYDPVFARFITPDSHIPGEGSAPQGFNRYSYALGNPVRLTDPDGHDPFSVLVGVGIGAAVGLVYSAATEGYKWATTDNYDYKAGALNVLGSTVGGGVTGGLIGLTNGLDTSHAVALGWAAQSAIAGGVVRRSITGEATTANNVAADASFGMLGYAAAQAAPAAAQWLNKSIDEMFTEPTAPAPPSPLIAPRGGSAPVLKGNQGVELSVAAAEARGETVLGREITFDVGDVRVRVDILTRTPAGTLKAIDAKNGPNARLTPNQKVGYPDMQTDGATPAGKNAQAAGLEIGIPLGPIEVQIDWWNGGGP